MKNVASQFGKREGWKYTSLFPLAQSVWVRGEIHCACSTPLQKIDLFPRVEFDNEGDQIVADEILRHATPRQLILNGLGEVDTTLSFDLADAEAYAALSIHVQGAHPLTLTETISVSAAQYNSLLFVNVDAGANLTHVRIVDTDALSILLAPVHAQVGAGGVYTQVLLTRGGKILRCTVQGELQGETAHIDLRGIHRLGGDAHADHSIFMRHMVPNCTSNQSLRYIVEGEAQGAFQGKIQVARNAQKTAAYQLCKSLLLSETAQMNTKPELEIFADDVKCSHGATCGALDTKALFYMQSRGIPQSEAEKLLMQAFIEDAFEGLPIKDEIKAFVL